ncbi:MAG: hypothetical protein ACJAZN_001212 [Planctomycetota bacterium]|jgi:hypothetical protein
MYTLGIGCLNRALVWGSSPSSLNSLSVSKMSESASVASLATLLRRRALGLSPALLAAVAAGTSPALAIAIAPVEPYVQVPAVSSSVDARVDVVEGRAVLVSQTERPSTLRRGSSARSLGDAHLELAAGSQARISLDGEMTLDVFGPSSVEWRAGDEGVDIVFYELGWADVSVRAGQHGLALPADWVAEFGRTSFHLRALPGGPTELRHNAGTPITLDWRGDETRVRPPVSVYAGSSVRLDRPRFQRIQGGSVQHEGTSPWREDGRGAWPWRSRTDTAAQAQEREVLGRETQVLDEIPGAPKGEIARLRAFEADGSSQVRPLRRNKENGQTYAQVPVTPGAVPRIEIVSRPGMRGLERVNLPRRPETGPMVTDGPLGTWGSTHEGAQKRIQGSSTASPHKSQQEPNAPAPERAAAAPADSSSLPSPSRAFQGTTAPTKPFVPEEWRGLSRRGLNGTGEIAAERGSGVEVRLLGAGRMKVFVSASSPAPRWCFTPTKDYLMSPGAVAVFEEDGSLRMKFGEVQEMAPAEGRPSFSRLSN